MWWNDWYDRASSAVGGAMTAAQETVSGLFREPTYGSGAYQPDDVPLSDTIRSRQSGSPQDLFSVDPGPFPVMTDIDQAILSRPKSWDEMSLWEKAKTYVGIVPGAVADTVGLSSRPGASTPVSGPSAGLPTIGNTISDTANKAAQAVGGVASSALGLPPGGLGGFLGSTLSKVLIGLVVIVVGLFMVNRILNRAGV